MPTWITSTTISASIPTRRSTRPCAASSRRISPSDDVYFNFGTDDLGWYLVNNMLDTGATTFGGFGAAVSPTADTPDGAGLLVAGQKAFRVGAEELPRRGLPAEGNRRPAVLHPGG